ncbi:MAG: YfbU family protein [Paracoccaceae bacterium]|nr:YfbU family protein [Paracoccaceae bacterium]MDE2917839.1 YfbU family protein [Paracoccaceae bacterium]
MCEIERVTNNLKKYYSSGKVDDTIAIMSMWERIELAIADLDEEDKVRLAEVTQNALYRQFEGFDMNNDFTHYRIAKKFIEKTGLYNQFQNRLNSHCQLSLPRYLLMLNVYNVDPDDLDYERIVTILNA